VNCPGFANGISGAELAAGADTRARRFGADVLIGPARVGGQRQDRGRAREQHDGARGVIIAAGVVYRRRSHPALGARKWLRCDRHGDILTAYRFLAAEEAPPA
jgi:thioredoxin reductase